MRNTLLGGMFSDVHSRAWGVGKLQRIESVASNQDEYNEAPFSYCSLLNDFENGLIVLVIIIGYVHCCAQPKRCHL